MTANVEGEVQLDEDQDDAELYEPEFKPPAASAEDPERQLERKAEVEQAISALAQVPSRDRMVFELAAVEGFSKEEVGRIMNLPPAEVERITDHVRQIVRRQLRATTGRRAS